MNGIAIIGVGCRFPGGVADARSYWSLLREGRCAISEVPADRWSLDGFYDPRPGRPGRSISKWGGFLNDVRGFDPQAFGLSNREAADMDPQQRLLLQTACEAIEDARLPRSALSRARTGVFIGVSNNDYGYLQRYRHKAGDRHAGTGTALSIVANRISHCLDFKGPSLCVDTACSSALVALDIACRALRDGACDLALAGGVNVLLDPRLFVSFSHAGMLSPRGRVSAFGEGADGFVRGEGAGVVLLKAVGRALRDGDPILAVIRSTAVNQDGATGAITAPDEMAQAAMIREGLQRAGASPADILLVEAHGTGTAVGDPVEASAVARALCGEPRAAPLLLGSAKAAIGHLEPAAGIAGLIKAALSLHNGECPPMADFRRPNPSIPLRAMGLNVPTKPMALPPGRGLALVNAFGFGGTNACAILEAPPVAHTDRQAMLPRVGTSTPLAVPLSAVSEPHLRAWAGAMADALTYGGPLSGESVVTVAAALAIQRDHLPYRAAVIAATPAELRERLRELAKGREGTFASRELPRFVTGKARAQSRLVFAFTGQGGQFWNMGRGLIESDAHFREWLEHFDGLFRAEAGWSVRDALLAPEGRSRVGDPAVTPAAMFALQAGIAHSLKQIGIVPDMVIGHSFGEVSAAHVTGGLPLEAVPRLVSHRGLIRRRIDRRGAMAAIAMSKSHLTPYLPDDGSIEIGAFNSPDAVTVSGEETGVEALLERLAQTAPGVRTHKLDLDFAWHSSWLDPVEHRFLKDVGEIACREPDIPVISTVTGLPETRFDSTYWWRNLRQPVRFAAAVRQAIEMGADTFLDIGPKRTLSGFIAECASRIGADVITVSALHKGEDDRRALACAIGKLWSAGVAVDWRRWAGCDGRTIALPRTPWLNRDHWEEPPEVARILRPPSIHPLLGIRDESPVPSWTSRISLAAMPWLGDHRIDGRILFPAAGFIEMFRAAALSILESEAIELRDVRFHQPLELSGDTAIELHTHYAPDRQRLTVHARKDDDKSPWTLITDVCLGVYRGRFPTMPPLAATGHGAVDPYERQCGQLQGYGPQFRMLRTVMQTGRKTVCRLRAPDASEEGLLLDPRMFDGCLQSLLCAAEDDGSLFLPDRIEYVRLAGPLKADDAVHAHAYPTGSGLCGDLLAGEPGQPAMIVVQGLFARRLARAGNDGVPVPGVGAFYLERHIRLDLAETPAAPIAGRWLLVSRPDGEAAARLADSLAGMGFDTVNVPLTEDQLQSPGQAARALDNASGGKDIAAVLYACPLDLEARGDTASIVQAFTCESWKAIQFAQALDRAACATAPLWFFTRGIGPTREAGAPGGPALIQSGLAPIARTVALERPERIVRCVDLDDEALDNADVIARLLCDDSLETEFVLRGRDVWGPRLRCASGESLERRKVPLNHLAGDQNFALTQPRLGALDSVEWRSIASRALKPGKVRVAVHHAGLNFRDVMAATDTLPADAEPEDASSALGMEFQGTVSEVTRGVSGFAPGDRVFGIGKGALRRFLDVPAASLHAVPANLRSGEAAGIPVAFLTAWHALGEIARLKPGETVLIHSATGGVGLAAIAVARHLGADVLATAGSQKKRDYLRDMGIGHVFDSRQPGFAAAIREATGAGVDVVLNALGGGLLGESVRCLAPYGRFVELGKRDLYEDATLGLRGLRRNQSFHVVDLAAMLDDRPQDIRRMIGELSELFEAGALTPLPVNVLGASDVVSAFRSFARARHIGKIVLDMRDPATKVCGASPATPIISRRGTYLVTGGGRGFGLEIGRWLAAKGAGRVVLTSRGDAAAGDMGASGIQSVVLDVRDTARVKELVGRLASDPLPLRGIVHAAVEYDDALLEAMRPDRLRRVVEPKAAGAMALTEAVLATGIKLDFFVGLSSLAQVTGWPGQTNYAAANGFLAALARHQRALGIPGQCINLGVLAESGFVSRHGSLAEYLRQSGWGSLSRVSVLEALETCIGAEASEITFADADWQRLATVHAPLARSARLGVLIASAAGDGAVSARGLLSARDARRLVCKQLMRVLQADDRTLAGYDTLTDAGLDSLSSLELRNGMELESGLHIPIGRFSHADTIDDLVRLLCELSAEAAQKEPAVLSPERPAQRLTGAGETRAAE